MVLKIRFGYDMKDDYPGRLGKLMNELRTRMETEEWKRDWREAEAAEDHEAMDRLDRDFNLIGLP